jgi:flavin reductase (DIM6/NTAB) family NADH-FMN oxidoreductase RutF
LERSFTALAQSGQQDIRNTSSDSERHETEPARTGDQSSDQTILKNERAQENEGDIVLSNTVRELMRRVPHPVAVVSASWSRKPFRPSHFSDSSPKEYSELSPHNTPVLGLIVSSFNTITLRPIPYVSFNIKLPSQTYDGIVSTGKFEISPMWSSIAARPFSGMPERFASTKDEPYAGRTLKTLYRGRIFTLQCKWVPEKSISVGDHVIMVGEVVRCKKNKKYDYPALVYCDGEYRYSGPAQRVVEKKDDVQNKDEESTSENAG